MMAIMRTTNFITSYLLVVSLYLSLASAFENINIDPMTKNCMRPITCKECTRETCYWSLQRQLCQASSDDTLTVGSVKACPVLTAVYDGHAFRVKVSNDMIGILRYMTNTTIKCWRGPTGPSVGRVVETDKITGEIVCDNHPTSPAVRRSNATILGSFYVTFGLDDVMLRTDDRVRFYKSVFYDKDCGSREWTKLCLACNITRMYVQYCSVTSWRDTRRCVDWMVDQDDPELSRGCYDGPDDENLCKRATRTEVTFNPKLAALMDANVTEITVNVNGHRMLFRKGLMRVTVAGHECERLFTLSDNQFQCTVEESREAAVGRSGRVVVEYTPDRRNVQFCGPDLAATTPLVAVRDVKESSALFTFVRHASDSTACDPRPVPGQTLAGILSGYTTLLVRWTGLECVDQSERFLWNVENNETGTKYWNSCIFIEYSTTVCYTPRTRDDLSIRDATAAACDHGGLIRRYDCTFSLVEAATGRTIYVPCDGAGYFAYSDPVFDNFEMFDNDLVTIFVVYGRHIGTPGVQRSDILVQFPGGGPIRDCIVQRLSIDRLECFVDQKPEGVREFIQTVQKLIVNWAKKTGQSSVTEKRREITTATTPPPPPHRHHRDH